MYFDVIPDFTSVIDNGVVPDTEIIADLVFFPDNHVMAGLQVTADAAAAIDNCIIADIGTITDDKNLIIVSSTRRITQYYLFINAGATSQIY
jgi:hypothetical protein